MRRATNADREKVVRIITNTFMENPGVLWMLNSGNRAKKIQRLAEFAFIKSHKRDGAFLSNNEKGVALCYIHDDRRASFKEIYYQLRFALTSVSLKKIPLLVSREKTRNQIRTKGHKRFRYFWFLGVEKNGANAARELGREIKELARKENLPIYLETAMQLNRQVYERYGFVTYHEWINPEQDIQFWFLRWVP